MNTQSSIVAPPRGVTVELVLTPHPSPLTSSREVCGKCGSLTIIDDIDDARWGRHEKTRKCWTCGSPNILREAVPDRAQSSARNQINRHIVGAQLAPDVSLQEKVEPSPVDITGEEAMTDKQCERDGCTKYGSFDHKCVKHFKEAHGIGYRDYVKRKKAGETKEEIFANPKGQAAASQAAKKTLVGPVELLDHVTELQTEERKDLLKKDVSGILYRLADDFLPGKIIMYTNEVLYVRFTDHPDLRAKLNSLAHDDFRTPEDEILFLISQADKILAAAHTRSPGV